MRGYQDRCGYGPRLPLLVISPYARANYVNHALTDQTSIIRPVHGSGHARAKSRAEPLAASRPAGLRLAHPPLQPLRQHGRFSGRSN
ncbi:MAG: alkaline phosphatase family protein [Streptosporangiaceae bacterium]